MTRNEAITWTRTHSMRNMRRKAAKAAGVLDLWDAYMAAMWQDDQQVRDSADAMRVAIDTAYPAAICAPSPGACKRCGGTGYIRAFSHIHGGRCLACAA